MNNNIPIQQVIDQGLKIMQNGQVTDAMYQVWVELFKINIEHDYKKSINIF